MRLFLLTLLSLVVFNVTAQSPRVTLSKTSISTEVDLGSTTTQTFTIRNTGTSTLFWNLKTLGNPVNFTKTAYADWTLPANQDRISDNVWITRKDNQAIFNIASESGYTSTSPANTRWVYGKSEDHVPADYTNWVTAISNNPSGMIGNVISMHSILDDRYFDITFNSYAGSNSGGGFSYTRVESGLPWIEADVTAGSLLPGEVREITLTLSTNSLAGGLNQGNVVIESNDPAFSERNITIDLTVHAPEIDATSPVALGEGYVGIASVLPNTVSIYNYGSGPLAITNIQSSESAFVPQTTSINILPGESYELAVSFIPSTLGANTANLTITSNDEDEPNFIVAISAAALDAASAPVLAVNPSSFTQNLESGTTASQDLLISNTGTSALDYTIEFSLGKSAPVTFTKANYADPMIPENQDRISANILITRANNQGLFNAKEESFFMGGTSPVNTMWTNTSTAIAQETGASYTDWRNAINSDPLFYVDKVTSMYLPDEDRFFDIEVKQWTPNSNGGGFSYERTEIYNWVTSSTTSGSINPAESATISLDFNASMLPAGTYTGFFTIKSNDPLVPVKEIAVTLVISGNPEASIYESDVAFDDTVAGLTSTKKVRVINDGTETLEISAISFDDAEFMSSQSVLTVPPFSIGYLEIIFAPTAAESYAGNVTLTTNDIDNPTLTVPYTGNGLVAGDINVVTESMNATVATGNTVTKTITVENTGTGTINWSASMLNTNPVVTFEKENYADSKLEQNQDRISSNVWLTRGDIMGLYNAALEEVYDDNSYTSPLGTEWQFGSSLEADLNNYSSWRNAVSGNPPNSVGETYSLHAGNEYYDVTFRSWTIDDGGGFSYERQKAIGWIKLDTYSGSIASGGSTSITVTYDPSDYVAGTENEVLVITSDDPDEAAIQIPIQLIIEGEPEIASSLTSLDFGSLGVQTIAKTLSVELSNTGTDVLNISSITSDNAAFTVTTTSASIPVGESVAVAITFTPDAVQAFAGNIQITSNDPNQNNLMIAVSGTGIALPEIVLTPAEITELTPTGATKTGTIVIENTGAADLQWQVGTSSLTSILNKLNADGTSILDVIPNSYNFSYDGGSNYIDDGGNDMYDGGNYLNTDLASDIEYSDNAIVDGSAFFGAGTQYFTRHLNGLFVMVADVNGITDFSISGDNGADGNGNVEGAELLTTIGGVQYTGYVKRIYNAGDPSINQLIIVESDGNVTQAFSTNTNNSGQTLANLSAVTRIYYLLYAGEDGEYIGNESAKVIMNKFLSVISGGNGFISDWVTLDAYQGTVAPGTSATVNYTIDLTSYPDGNYTGVIPIGNNDFDESQVSIPVQFNKGGVARINELADVLVNEGFGSTQIDISNLFVDASGGALTYTFWSDATQLSGNISGTTLTINEGVTGTSTVSVSAKNAGGKVAFEDFNFRTNAIPEVSTPIADQVFVKGFGSETINAASVFTDADSNDNLALSVTSSDPSVVTASILNGSITLTDFTAGTSTISVTANDGFGGSATETFLVTVNKAAATIALSNTVFTYDGAAKAVTATTTPAGLSVNVVYSQGGSTVAAPMSAGTYDVVATINDVNYQGTTTGTLTINKASATITLSNTVFTYDGTAKAVTATTTPAGITVDFVYSQGGSVVASPVNVGTYAVEATINNANYQGSATGTLTINKADASIVLSNTVLTYDGTAKAVTATTTPAGITVDFVYTQGGSVVASPVNVGTYAVEATINDANYQGSTTGTLTINKADAAIVLSNTVFTYDGTAKAVTATTTPVGITVDFVYSQGGSVVASPINAGIYTVEASINDVNYQGSITGTFTINKAEQTIIFNSIANVLNSAAPFALSATSSSGLSVSFEVVSGPATVSGNIVTLTGETGDVVIKASQTGNSNYNATSINNTFRVDMDPILGISDEMYVVVQAWPVPASDYLQIKTGVHKMQSLTLIDVSGKNVFSAEPQHSEYTMEVSTYTSGIYYLKIVTDKGVLIRRVQIKR